MDIALDFLLWSLPQLVRHKPSPYMLIDDIIKIQASAQGLHSELICMILTPGAVAAPVH